MELNRYSEAISAFKMAGRQPEVLRFAFAAGSSAPRRGHTLSGECLSALVAAGDPLPRLHRLAQVLLRTGRAEEAASELANAGRS